jgi:hypothetical protein
MAQRRATLHQQIGELAIVGEKNQSFRVLFHASNGEQAGAACRTD